jgi:hypothetical protein
MGKTITIPCPSESTIKPIWRYYYYAGSARIAMRVKDDSKNLVFYLFTDHLGSTNVTIIPRFLGERSGGGYGEPQPVQAAERE